MDTVRFGGCASGRFHLKAVPGGPRAKADSDLSQQMAALLQDRESRTVPEAGSAQGTCHFSPGDSSVSE